MVRKQTWVNPLIRFLLPLGERNFTPDGAQGLHLDQCLVVTPDNDQGINHAFHIESRIPVCKACIRAQLNMLSSIYIFFSTTLYTIIQSIPDIKLKAWR